MLFGLILMVAPGPVCGPACPWPDTGAVARPEDRHFFEAALPAADEMCHLAWRSEYEMGDRVKWNDQNYATYKKDADWRYECWQLLATVAHPERNVFAGEGIPDPSTVPPYMLDEIRRDYLERLRIALGDEDYFAGRMPLPTPPLKIPYKD